jgi:transcriptional regulator with XRE-family HTH domain
MTFAATPSRILTMEMYFLAMAAAIPSSAVCPAIQAGPILINISQPALPQHTHTFRRLRSISGLSMTRLAEILGVERRTLYFWDEGKPIKSPNENHLEAVLSGIESMEGVAPELMRKSILAINEQGFCSADRFRERLYHEAVAQLGQAILNRGNSSVGMRGLGHRRLAQILSTEDSDEGVLAIDRAPKQTRIPRKVTPDRA